VVRPPPNLAENQLREIDADARVGANDLERLGKFFVLARLRHGVLVLTHRKFIVHTSAPLLNRIQHIESA
jgi:hypothetical protein